jgi:phosphoenolpyruvate-protein kinase (PTS system EI component)
VSIRTFDLRPDKLASYSHLGAAAARPFDWRLVLESAPLQQLFRAQVRAVLRAAKLGPVRLLIPLVTRTELLDFVLETVTQAKLDLDSEGLAFAADVPLGVMIETAAAVPLVPAWAGRVDFLALGTNDLTASSLGLDRDDPVVIGQADALHPGVLHLLRDVINAGHIAGRQVTVCGEMAADPFGAMALAALGVDRLSVPVNQYAATPTRLADLSGMSLAGLAELLLGQPTALAVRDALRQWRASMIVTGW